MAGHEGNARDRRWPNLFVVGAPKAGTTSLWRYLGAHPDIFMSPVKEPNFFASFPYGSSIEDAKSYLGLFAGTRGERFRGEASAIYLWPEDVPRRIRGVSPDARIVISLREPVARAHSHYWHWVQWGQEQRTFLEAVRDELREDDIPSDRPAYVGPGLYAAGVERYLDTFGDRTFVLFFDELVVDPLGVARRLYEFLEVDPIVADRLDPDPQNPFALPRSRLAGRLMRSPAAWRVARAIVPRRLRDPIFNTLMPPGRGPKPDPESVELLRRTYEPDVAALRELLGRPFPEAWERRFPAAASPAEARRG